MSKSTIRGCSSLLQTRLKVAPYSLRSHARWGREIKSNLHAKENISVFRYFMMSTWAQTAKLTVNFLVFPPVKFRKIWQLGSKCFTLVGASFSWKSIRPVFWQRWDINLQKSKNLPLQTPLFSCLKFVSRRKRYAVKILDDFTHGNWRKSQIKP